MIEKLFYRTIFVAIAVEPGPGKLVLRFEDSRSLLKPRVIKCSLHHYTILSKTNLLLSKDNGGQRRTDFPIFLE